MDAAFTVRNGKLCFARRSDGDIPLDDRAVYSVFTTLFAVKGGYFADGTVGTTLSAIRKDGGATGTRIRGCGADAAEQLTDDRLVRSLSVEPRRLRSGAWVLTLTWQSPSGDQQSERATL